MYPLTNTPTPQGTSNPMMPLRIGNYDCYFTLTEDNITAKIVSKVDLERLDWEFTKQQFDKNAMLVTLYGSIDKFMEDLIAEPSMISISQKGIVTIKIDLVFGRQKQKSQSILIQIKKNPLTEVQSLKVQNKRLFQKNKQLTLLTQKFQTIKHFFLRQKDSLDLLHTQFIPNTLEYSYSDFSIIKNNQLKVIKKKRDKQYSRLSHHKPIKCGSTRSFYRFKVSSLGNGEMFIGLSATHWGQPNSLIGPNSQIQVVQSIHLLALSLARMKVEMFIKNKIVPVIASEKEREYSLDNVLNGQKTIEMFVDIVKGIVVWFLEGYFVDCAKIDHISVAWECVHATIYYYSVNETVVFR